MARQTTLYRYLTGPDDAAFCHRVSEALSHLTFDAAQGRVVCGQAIIKDIDGPYTPDLKLSEH